MEEHEEGRIVRPWTMRNGSALLLLAALVPAIVAVDYLSGDALSMRLPYFLVTALAAWHLGRTGGIAVAIVAAAFDVLLDAPMRLETSTSLEVAWDAATYFVCLLLFALAVAAYRRALDTASSQSPIDAETGLVSRREFERRLDAEVRRAGRYRRPLALILIECSGLKGGAAPGVLAAVGRAGQAHVREGDLVGRVGDQRLGILLLECNADTAGLVSKRLKERLEEAMHQKLRTGSLAIGVVSYGGQSPSSFGNLLHLADAQLRFARGDRGVQSSDASVV
jgi:diguanylate cyclase (GGDEF)-like protein